VTSRPYFGVCGRKAITKPTINVNNSFTVKSHVISCQIYQSSREVTSTGS
jgi:hypothetical protein